MSTPILVALVASAAHVVAAAVRVPGLGWIAVVASLTAAVWRAPHVGAAVVGLATAAGIGLAAEHIKAQKWHGLAALFTLPAVCFATAPIAGGWLASFGVAVGIFALCLAVCAAATHGSRAGPFARVSLALILVVAPLPLTIVVPMGAAAEWPLGVAPIAALYRGPLLLDAAGFPQWAATAWQLVPWIAAAGVLLALTGRKWPPRVGLGIAFGLALAATIGVWPQLQAWLDGGAQRIAFDPGHLPLASPSSVGSRGLDASGALLLIPRLGAAWLLIHEATSEDVRESTPVWDFAVATTALIGLAVWCVVGPEFVGPYAFLDPVAGALLGAVIASFALLVWRTGHVHTAFRVAQLACCALVLGGEDLGWRVASAWLGA